MVYWEIHKLHMDGFSNSAIARKLNISRNRVINYLQMSPERFQEFALSLQNRGKKLDPYHQEIVEWIKLHPDISGAQIYDWLEEKLKVKGIAENTVRNYVNEIRESYHIPKQTVQREYAAVQEVPMGQQAQVDFGQLRVLSTSGEWKRLYFIGFVLANSRYKYVEWLDRPFQAADVVHMHENAFRYFEGMPLEIVYDQDRLLAVSENAGDLIMTADFTRYQQTRNFKIYLCRKSDPESKGKIEQVVKYVKNNFAKNRIFDNLVDWQEGCLKWLIRTGNHKVHHNTKKRPSEVHALEKQYLQKVYGTYIFENVYVSSITRTIQKDNVIRYGANRYSVPLGTYKKGSSNIAYVQADEQTLYIRLQKNGNILAQHLISKQRGALISDPAHRERNRSKRELFIQQIEEVIVDKQAAKWLIETLSKRYPRHLLDQLKVVQSVILKYPSLFDQAIDEMIRLKLNSANDLRDIAVSLDIHSRKNKNMMGEINEKYKDLAAPEREEDIYINVLTGGRK